MVKMIVLEVDEPHPDDQKEKGTLGEILERHFVKAGREHDPPLGVQVDMRYIVEEEGGKIPSVEEFEGVRGILITGSTYDAYGDNPWIVKLMDLIKRKSVSRGGVIDHQSCGGDTQICTLAVSALATRSYVGHWAPKSVRHLQATGS